MRVTAQQLAALVGGELAGDPELVLTRLGPLAGADRSTLSFLSNPRYRAQLAASQAGCVLVSEQEREAVAGRASAVLCRDPYLAYARVSQWWARQSRELPAPGIHPSAVIASSAQVHPSASVGPLAVVEEGARVGPRARIGAQCLVGPQGEVGEDTLLAARVSLMAGCRIGARGIVHAGAVIGADGFGFAPAGGHWEKIEQLGAVRIGDDVEIGANTCIDRGALEDTVLDNGVKLDNLVQIGHNVQVGAHTAMAGCVGVAGSARIGAHCTLGGGAIVLGHLELADHVHVSAATVITRSILKPGAYSGVFPFDANASWERNAATLRQLHAMRDRLRAIEARLRA
ncbi:MAG: UDP-3-O-(3-hydroxymyristoyl)glucosamine N-acyltransferase [Rubrivivax sp.]